jgi:hypothetical protein
MKRMLDYKTWLAITALLCTAATCSAQAPEMPKPTKEHELLKQFAGDWKLTAEAEAAPGQEPIKAEGTESATMLGEFWLIGKSDSKMAGMSNSSVLTIGYDPKEEQYIGTFYCTADSTLWKYAGEMDESGKKLTLKTEGPSMFDPMKTAKYREVLELVDPDHKTFTSFIEGPDGKWMKMVEMKYERKK